MYLRATGDELTAIVPEGSAQKLNVCVEVADLPSGGLGCDVLVTFRAIQDTASKSL